MSALRVARNRLAVLVVGALAIGGVTVALAPHAAAADDLVVSVGMGSFSGPVEQQLSPPGMMVAYVNAENSDSLAVELNSGRLPDGVSLGLIEEGSSGTNRWAQAVLTGTPTELGTFNFTVKVTSMNGATPTTKTTGQLTLRVVGATVQLPAMGLSSGEKGQPYDNGIFAYCQAWCGTFSSQVVGGELPPGLSLGTWADPATSLGGASSANLTGTPTEDGTFSFTLKVTNTAQSPDGLDLTSSSTRTFTLRIRDTASTRPVIGSSGMPDSAGAEMVSGPWSVGAAFDWRPYLEAGDPDTVTWSLASGQFPTWLTLDPANGEMSGTPNWGDDMGSRHFTLKACNPAGCDTQKYYFYYFYGFLFTDEVSGTAEDRVPDGTEVDLTFTLRMPRAYLDQSGNFWEAMEACGGYRARNDMAGALAAMEWTEPKTISMKMKLGSAMNSPLLPPCSMLTDIKQQGAPQLGGVVWSYDLGLGGCFVELDYDSNCYAPVIIGGLSQTDNRWDYWLPPASNSQWRYGQVVVHNRAEGGGTLKVNNTVSGSGADLLPSSKRYLVKYSYTPAGASQPVEGELSVAAGETITLPNSLLAGTVVTLSAPRPLDVVVGGKTVSFAEPRFMLGQQELTSTAEVTIISSETPLAVSLSQVASVSGVLPNVAPTPTPTPSVTPTVAPGGSSSGSGSGNADPLAWTGPALILPSLGLALLLVVGGLFAVGASRRRHRS